MYLYIYIHISSFFPSTFTTEDKLGKHFSPPASSQSVQAKLLRCDGRSGFPVRWYGGQSMEQKKVPGQQVLSGMDLFIIHTYIVPTICSKCVCVCDWISMLCWSRSYGINMYEFRNLCKFIHKFGTTCSMRELALWVKLWDWTKSWEQLTVDPQLLTKVKPVMWNDVIVIWCYCTGFPTDFQQLTITTLEDILCSHSLRSFFLPFNASWNVGDWMWCNRRSFDQMWSNSSHSSSHIALRHCRKLNWAPFISPWTDWDFPCDSFVWFFDSVHSALDVISGDLASTQGSDLTPRLSKGCAPLTQPHPARRSPGMG